MPKGDATWPKMTIDECLAFADKWSRGMTIHAGSQGWRVVCMLLAEEVRAMRHALPDDFSESQEWREGSTVERIDWLIGLHCTALEEIDRLSDIMQKQGALILMQEQELLDLRGPLAPVPAAFQLNDGLRKDGEHSKGDF